MRAEGRSSRRSVEGRSCADPSLLMNVWGLDGVEPGWATARLSARCRVARELGRIGVSPEFTRCRRQELSLHQIWGSECQTRRNAFVASCPPDNLKTLKIVSSATFVITASPSPWTPSLRRPCPVVVVERVEMLQTYHFRKSRVDPRYAECRGKNLGF